MKNFVLSKNKLKSFFNNLKKFINRHYIQFFKNNPLIIFFVISIVFNSLLLRIITVKNWFYFKPLLIALVYPSIISGFSSI